MKQAKHIDYEFGNDSKLIITYDTYDPLLDVKALETLKNLPGVSVEKIASAGGFQLDVVEILGSALATVLMEPLIKETLEAFISNIVILIKNGRATAKRVTPSEEIILKNLKFKNGKLKAIGEISIRYDKRD